ncbi:hypothetical protein DTO021D3_5546 [Paecilomyces variotii]|nr:hypothetical protein DTO032I3_5084 [Paecilomyces variotii]KAJ9277495.1 hypothetical protein DTO021D3_5546 [Paecilomyces variotii]KAJ9283847.1 hypothetical protein DTO021C3_8570 [Paecilomyces variotii]KAJ9319806.1 hypothetical protein DTO027B3_9180 [Paecilomyces variotii]KAJ9342516.1 hypothetical protein DTO027B6_4840 [Paecilomyces variotii]
MASTGLRFPRVTVPPIMCAAVPSAQSFGRILRPCQVTASVSRETLFKLFDDYTMKPVDCERSAAIRSLC